MDKSFLFDRRRRLITILFCFVAILQSGLRDIENSNLEGDDTPTYQNWYNEIDRDSWSTLCDKFSFYTTDYEEREGGYAIFVKMTQYVYNDFRFFMFLTAAVFIIPLGVIIYKYVKTYEGLLLSFIIYFALFNSIVNCIMRQAVVLGFFLLALKYIKKRNWKMYYTIIALLFTMHNTIIIVIPLYFMPCFFSSRKWVMISLLAAPIITVFSGLLISRLFIGTVYEIYGDSDSFGLVNLLLLIYFISILVYKNYDKIKQLKDYEYLVCGVIGTLVCMPFIRIGGAFVRVSYYYFLFFIPLIPIVIDCVCKDRFIHRMAYAFSICFFLTFMIR